MSEIFNLYKSVESFIDNNCEYKKNEPFIINYSKENENSGGLPTIDDNSKYIQCVVNIPKEKQDILKDAKEIKINIVDSSFESVLYKSNNSPSNINCLLLLIINDIERVEAQEIFKTGNNKKELNNINTEHYLLENLKRFIYNYIKNNKKKNKSSDNVIETILLKDARDGIRFFNFGANGIDYENENTKKIIEIIKSIPSKLEIKKKTNEKNKPKIKNLNIISNQQFEISHEEKYNQNNDIEINNINKNNLIFDNNNNNEIISKYFKNEDNNNNINSNNNNNINNIHNFNNINNQNDLNNNNLNLNLKNQSCMVFPYNCNLCNEYPIVKVFYYCPVCCIPLCQKCEEKLGINHRHSILKVQTKEQFDDLNSKINGIPKEDKNLNKQGNNANQSAIQMIANNLSTIKDTVIGAIFGEENNSENDNNINIGLDNNNNNQNMMPKKMNLLQLARAKYDLNGISDNQLQEAIEKTNGNIDEAIILLMS